MKFVAFKSDEGLLGKWPVGVNRRGFRVKDNLPTFNDKKTNDAVTYHSWHWDMSVF